MKTSSSLRRPDEWPQIVVTWKSIAVVICVLGMGLIALLLSITAWSTGMRVFGGCILAFAGMLFFAAASGYLYKIRTPRGVSDIRDIDGGIEIKYSFSIFAVLVGVMACITIFCLGLAVEIFIAGYLPNVIIFGLLGAYSASFLGAVSLGRLRRGRLALTRDGIRQRGWSFESYFPWEAVHGARAMFFDYRAIVVLTYANFAWERRNTTWFWRIDRLPPGAMIELDCRSFNLDPIVLFHLVTFYANNPAARDELGTAAPLERVRTLNF